MGKFDLARLIDEPRSNDPMLLNRASSRIAAKDPELMSYLWMLREGVIERSHFKKLLTSALRS